MKDRKNQDLVYKDLKKLAEEFKDIEPNLEENAKKYLERAGQFFHDTVDKVVKTNFSNKLDYVLKLSRVPLKHLPYLQRNMWGEVEKHFTSEEVKSNLFACCFLSWLNTISDSRNLFSA